MSALTLRDYRTLRKFLVSAITEILEQNPSIKVPDICKTLKDEINLIEASYEDYLSFIQQNNESDEDPDPGDSNKIDYGKYGNQNKLMNP